MYKIDSCYLYMIYETFLSKLIKAAYNFIERIGICFVLQVMKTTVSILCDGSVIKFVRS